MKTIIEEWAGYSLTECLVVLLSTTVLATIAVPNIHRLHLEWSLWGGKAALESSLQWGRMHAISSNTPLIFNVADEGRGYCWLDADSGEPYRNSIRTLPHGLKIASYPGHPVRFYQHGNAAPAGTFVVSGEAGSYSIVVSPGGRIRTERN